MFYEYYISNVFAESPTNTTAIETLNEYRNTLKSKKELHIFDDSLSFYCYEKLICPICGSPLQIKSHKEYREFQGGAGYECISDYLKCEDEDCGYIYDLNN